MDRNSIQSKQLGTWHVMVAGVALVVAASTLVSDFVGFFTLGGAFAISLLLAFGINLFVGMSAVDLSVAYPRGGALYEYARQVFAGRRGKTLGVFLGIAFVGIFTLAVSGEIAAGAFGLRALLPVDLPLPWCIAMLAAAAVIPNIYGVKTVAWVSAGLLLLMLGIRWGFGVAGFLGVSGTGSWSATNLSSAATSFHWFGEGGVISTGLALAMWSFIGIEFACSLAEDVKSPKRAMPRGVIYGLLAILATSLLMGLGVTGTMPLEAWQAAMWSDLGSGGDAPQLAVGELMFGKIGYWLMALSSVAATLGSLVVAFGVLPRILHSIARDRLLFTAANRLLGRLHDRYQTPIPAILLVSGSTLISALLSDSVVDWVLSAAYAWIIIYLFYNLLAFANRRLHPARAGAFGNWFTYVPLLGAAATAAGLYYAFAGSHVHFGPRALIVLLLALGLAVSGQMKSRTFRLRRRFFWKPAVEN